MKAVDLVLGHLAELQGEGHVLVDGHVGIQGVALEHHGDIPVFGFHVVHELPVDVQLAAADFLQAGHHAQGGGLAAAGGANQDDELVVLNIQVEGLHGHNALVRHLEVGLLFRGALLGLFLPAAVGIDLGDALQIQRSHCDSSLIPPRCSGRRRPGRPG